MKTTINVMKHALAILEANGRQFATDAQRNLREAIAREESLQASKSAALPAILGRGKYHKFTENDGTENWEWMSPDTTCPDSIDVLIVRADLVSMGVKPMPVGEIDGANVKWRVAGPELEAIDGYVLYAEPDPRYAAEAAHNIEKKQEPKTSTLTLGSGHSLQQGDKVSMDFPDNRWWKRLWAKLLFRPAPKIREYFVVTETIGNTSCEIRPAKPR